jgi:hypothetical protein
MSVKNLQLSEKQQSSSRLCQQLSASTANSEVPIATAAEASQQQHHNSSSSITTAAPQQQQQQHQYGLQA